MRDSLLNFVKFYNDKNGDTPVYLRDGIAFFDDKTNGVSVACQTFLAANSEFTLKKLFDFRMLRDFEFSLELKKAASKNPALHSPNFITPIGTFVMPDTYIRDVAKILRCCDTDLFDKVIFNNWITACTNGQSFALVKMPTKWPISFFVPADFLRVVTSIDDKLVDVHLNNERIQFNFTSIRCSSPIEFDNIRMHNFGFLNQEFRHFEMEFNLKDIAMINQVNEDGLLEMIGDYYCVGTSKHKVQKSTVNCSITLDSMRKILPFTGFTYKKSENDTVLRFESDTIVAGAAKCIYNN